MRTYYALALLCALLACSACARELLQQRVTSRRLPAPCIVPDAYYPLRTCRVERSPSVCGRGFNAWPNIQECCQRGTRGAFPEGCTDFNRNVTCFVADSYWPKQTCGATNNITKCSENWGQWKTEAECCKPGRAFEDGCTLPEPCWAASTWFPERSCSLTEDQAICTRGWGAFQSQEECCQPGNGFSDGCTEDAASI